MSAMKNSSGDLMETNEIGEVLKNLTHYINIYLVLSEEELRSKIVEEVSKIEEKRKTEIEKDFGESMEDLIFNSITTHEKLSINSPDLHVKINYLGETFYCPPSHRFMEAEISKAFLRLVESRIDFDRFKTVVLNFMQEAGYKTEVIEGENKILAEKDGFEPLYLRLLPTINVVPDMLEEFGGEVNVFIVPTEKTPWAFVNFIRSMDEYFIPDSAMIWVANIKKGSIDPLIGEPGDSAITSTFDNPSRAKKAIQIWRRAGGIDSSFIGLS